MPEEDVKPLPAKYVPRLSTVSSCSVKPSESNIKNLSPDPTPTSGILFDKSSIRAPEEACKPAPATLSIKSDMDSFLEELSDASIITILSLATATTASAKSFKSKESEALLPITVSAPFVTEMPPFVALTISASEVCPVPPSPTASVPAIELLERFKANLLFPFISIPELASTLAATDNDPSPAVTKIPSPCPKLANSGIPVLSLTINMLPLFPAFVFKNPLVPLPTNKPPAVY